ncbi:MAG: polysaccharide deacetylase family protein, partial [Alistipes sp.]|nr:polysaccharide deacetylase family protein [Alistipes sp.]
MKQLFYAAALLAITLAGCTPKSAQDKRIEELTKRYDKFIALTFDDGPSTLTPKILDILEEYNATATFFVIGNQVDSTTEPIIRRAVSMGCEI